MESLISISEVNSMKDERFEWVFGNVIELCGEAATYVKNLRPFKDVTDLCDAFNKYLDDVSVEEKLKVLKSHPDLACRMAAQGQLTPESASEQSNAGLNNLNVEQKSIISSCNERYKEKFRFPFIICARENKVQSIIEGLKSRYNNGREQEIETGIHEVKKICRLRILDIVEN